MNTGKNILEEIQDKSIHAFLANNRIKTETGEELDFKKFHFLYDIYCDKSRKLVCKKAAQIGFTTYEILKTAHECYYEREDILYVLPTADDVRRFSGGKTNKIIAHNPILQSWTHDKDSIEQKQFGQNTVYYQGCISEDTEVLTKCGWKKYFELRIGDELPTININTCQIEDDEVLDMTIFNTEQEVLSIRNDAVDALVTKDHRCVVQNRGKNNFDIVSAFQLRPNSRQMMPQSTKGISKKDTLYSDAFVQVLGWVITEGTFYTEKYKSKFVRKNGTINPTIYNCPTVTIIQKKEIGKSKIRTALAEAGISYYEKGLKNGVIGFRINNESSKKIVSIIPNKRLSFDLVNSISRSQMELLADVMVAGDGHVKKDGFQVFIQKDRKTIDAFQYLISLIGKGSTVRFRIKTNSFSENEIGEVSIKTSKNITKYKINPINYKGVMWCPTTKNGTIITRRNGKVWITGQSWTERAALMITAKKLVVDEYDRCKQDIVEQYDSRLQSTANPKRAFFSNPSIPDFGVSKFYNLSDQKKWHITHSCGKTFVMDESCVDYRAQIYRCPHCNHEITDKERMFGEWIATSTGEWSGYWIPLWITPWMPASKIAEFKREKTPEYFANFVAGLEYIGGGDKVMPSTIRQCLSENVNEHGDRIIIGVDTGLPIHIVCANKQGFFYYDVLSDPTKNIDPYKEIEALMRRWPKSIVVADQGGDLVGIRKLQAAYPGRVFLVWYQRDRKNVELLKWGDNEEYGKVIADRNRMIQLFIDEMLDKRVVFNGTESEWQEYITHWMNIYRVWEENALGVKEFKWERTGPDHWVHATIYARIGLARFSDTQAKIIGTDPLDGLPRGQIVQSDGIASYVGAGDFINKVNL